MRFLTFFIIILCVFWPAPDKAEETPPVVLNELLWMGSPASAQDEWIELFNTTEGDIDLSGFRLTKRSSGVETDMLTIPAGMIAAQGYFLIANYADTDANSTLAVEPDLVNAAVSLVNTQLEITLYDADGALVDAADEGIGVPFAGAYESGAHWASMERHRIDLPGSEDAAWHTSSGTEGIADVPGFFATPKAENSNQAPEVLCDAPEEVFVGTATEFLAEASDPDGDVLSMHWEFPAGSANGETATETFPQEGEFFVTCTADDGRVQAADTVAVFVSSPKTVEEDAPTEAQPTLLPSGSAPAAAMPKFGDPGYVTSDQVLLTGLFSNPVGDDREGEWIRITNFSREGISLRGWAIADATRTYRFPEDAILKGGAERVVPWSESRITLNNAGDAIHLLDPFGTRVNGVEYGASVEGEFFLRDGDSVRWFWTGDAEEGDAAEAAAENGKGLATTIDALAFLERNTAVRFSGAVIALPGQIAAHTLFVANGDAFVRVYSSGDRFPELSLGQSVEVSGGMGEDRLGTKVNLGRDGTVVPSAERIEETVVQTLTGAVQEKSRATFILDTGEERVPVRIKSNTGIAVSEINVSARLHITGFFFAEEFLPRTSDDVQEEAGAVLGTAAAAPQEDAAPSSAVRDAPRGISISSVLALCLTGVLVLGSAIRAIVLRKRKAAA